MELLAISAMGKVDARSAVAGSLTAAYLAGCLVAATASVSASAVTGGVDTEQSAKAETGIASEPRGPRSPGRSASAELLQAAARNDFERVRAIASAGEADVNASGEDGWTALISAFRADERSRTPSFNLDAARASSRIPVASAADWCQSQQGERRTSNGDAGRTTIVDGSRNGHRLPVFQP